MFIKITTQNEQQSFNITFNSLFKKAVVITKEVWLTFMKKKL